MIICGDDIRAKRHFLVNVKYDYPYYFTEKDPGFIKANSHGYTAAGYVGYMGKETEELKVIFGTTGENLTKESMIEFYKNKGVNKIIQTCVVIKEL